MRHRRLPVGLIACILVLLLARLALPLVTTQETGTWPANWPKELEPLRKSAKTVEIATGIQQNIYEITFSDRETFEKAWPTILKVKTPGAPLTLCKVASPTPKAWGSLLSNATPAVRIYAPSEGYAGGVPLDAGNRLDPAALQAAIAEGKVLKAGAPWPGDLASPKGDLPEFVVAKTVDGKMKWVEAHRNEKQPLGFLNRARVDVELIVDGSVIDLNRIMLPAETPIIDERF
jgi:hypothetical protein